MRCISAREKNKPIFRRQLFSRGTARRWKESTHILGEGEQMGEEGSSRWPGVEMRSGHAPGCRTCVAPTLRQRWRTTQDAIDYARRAFTNTFGLPVYVRRSPIFKCRATRSLVLSACRKGAVESSCEKKKPRKNNGVLWFGGGHVVTAVTCLFTRGNEVRFPTTHGRFSSNRAIERVPFSVWSV